MKRFALLAFLVVIVAENVVDKQILPDSGAQRLCTKALKCRKENDRPYVAVRGRCCTTFNNNCEYFAYEQLYQPSFTAALLNPSECTCVVGNKFLVSPEDDNCKYERDPNGICPPIACNENEFQPVHANGPCGCKIFKNRCFFNQFNCAHKTKFVETTELAGCICRYEPRFTIDPIHPGPVISAGAAIGKEEESKAIPNPQPCLGLIKCGSNSPSVLAQNSCRCKVFPNVCEMGVFNAYFGPGYSPVPENEAFACSCYATPRWIEYPSGPRCQYVLPLAKPNTYCLTTDCNALGYKPVSASNGCECKVFYNECTMRKFNCYNVLQSTGELFSITEEPCACKYTPLR